MPQAKRRKGKNVQQLHMDGTTATTSSTSSTRTSLLVDAPDPWLMQLISGQYLDSDSKLSLFQTSKKFNHMVMQNSKSTCLKVDPVLRPMNKVQRVLQTANRHARNIKLSLYHKHGHNKSLEEATKSQIEMMHVVSSVLEPAAEQGSTTAVTELELHGVWLGPILPPAIGQACQNLRKLSLHVCTIDFDKTIRFSKHFENLQTLEIECCEFDYSGNEHAGNMPDTDKQGLAALSSLTKLHCGDTEADIINIVSKAAPLTHLIYWLDGDDTDNGSVEEMMEVVDWVQLGATLQHLELSGMLVKDEAMETFLQMPCLTHVLVMKFELAKSHAGRPCKWEELVITCSMDVKTLAYLPLHPGLLLKLGGPGNQCDYCKFVMDRDTSHVSQALTNVERARALKWLGLILLEDYEMEAFEIARWLLQVFPLIQGATGLVIETAPPNWVTMQVLCDFVRGRNDKPSVNFRCHSNWDILDMIDLIIDMPHDGLSHHVA